MVRFSFNKRPINSLELVVDHNLSSLLFWNWAPLSLLRFISASNKIQKNWFSITILVWCHTREYYRYSHKTHKPKTNSTLKIPVSYTHLDVYKRQTIHATFLIIEYKQTSGTHFIDSMNARARACQFIFTYINLVIEINNI